MLGRDPCTARGGEDQPAARANVKPLSAVMHRFVAACLVLRTTQEPVSREVCGIASDISGTLFERSLSKPSKLNPSTPEAVRAILTDLYP